jgi:hypothetical protein
MKLGPIARALAIGMLCFAVLAALLAARAVLEARAAQAQAAISLEEGDFEEAVAWLRRSARWNGPGNVYARDSLARLEQLADEAFARGDHAGALSAYRGVHGAIHAASGVFMYERARLSRVDRQIAALMANQASPRLGAARGRGEREDAYAALLRGERPNAGWALFACAGFFTWVIAASVFLLRGVDAKGRVVRRVARRSGLVLLLGWIAFALGLRLA